MLGDWNYVEKDSGCGEVSNRQLTLSYGSNGTQTVDFGSGGPPVAGAGAPPAGGGPPTESSGGSPEA